MIWEASLKKEMLSKFFRICLENFQPVLFPIFLSIFLNFEYFWRIFLPKLSEYFFLGLTSIFSILF